MELQKQATSSAAEPGSPALKVVHGDFDMWSSHELHAAMRQHGVRFRHVRISLSLRFHAKGDVNVWRTHTIQALPLLDDHNRKNNSLSFVNTCTLLLKHGFKLLGVDVIVSATFIAYTDFEADVHAHGCYVSIYCSKILVSKQRVAESQQEDRSRGLTDEHIGKMKAYFVDCKSIVQTTCVFIHFHNL